MKITIKPNLRARRTKAFTLLAFIESMSYDIDYQFSASAAENAVITALETRAAQCILE